MNTPICDFVRNYATSSPLRLHMPGHKGVEYLGCEGLDITEISGADSLFQASGIIAESEKNAGSIFGADTFYSTEGSSLSIRAMLHLAALWAKEKDKTPLIAAGRNAHKAFLSAAALIDFDILWLSEQSDCSYLSCPISAEYIETVLKQSSPAAVYITSPDYLGNTADISALAKVCHKYDTLLLVDNAHGAYLKFFGKHPIELGADMCCDSAHKTLPVLTGGGYLHISRELPDFFRNNAKNALALYGSTSPSYLILQSLDMANKVMAGGYAEKIKAFAQGVDTLKQKLASCGYTLSNDEPLKITILAKKYGYSGTLLAEKLEKSNIHCEFADPDFIVFMLTPHIGIEGLDRLSQALTAIPKADELCSSPPVFSQGEQKMSVRSALFSPCETIPTGRAVGKVLASPSVGCPPAVPIAVCGELITQQAAEAFAYYGIEQVTVVK
ncbi:MAG: aminotransferase class V-fold PLP-dependent enzyme [Clostridia bacterium]|nr:aminotransferase class V-fold PLP-dependent enzyme [Clostridia bacterium]